MWNQDEIEKARAIRKAQEQQKALDDYNAQKASLDNKYNGGLGGFLGNIIGGIGKGIGDTVYGIGGMFGTAGAAVKDIVEGKAGTAENQNAFKRTYYGATSDKDAAAKAAGNSLNAATNLATMAVPGLAGAGSAVGKALGGVAANTIGGAIGGVADELAQQGENARLDSATNRAISGAAGGLIGGKVGSKLGNATSKVGGLALNNKLATSAIGRGAIAGATGGATAGGVSAALGGGDIVGSALQGGMQGAIGGASQGAIMSGVNRAGQKVKNKLGFETELPTTTPTTTEPTTDETSTDYVEARGYASKTKKDNIADALDNTGKYLQGAQAALNKSDKKAIGVKDTGRFIDGVRKKTGIDVLSKQADFAKEITGGADSILDTAQRNALAYDVDGKPFYADTSDIFNGIDGVLRDAKVTGSALGGRNQRDKFVQDLQNDLIDSNGDLLSLASSWHDTAATLRKSDAKGAKIQAKVYETMARKVEDASYAKIPQDNVDAMFDVSSMKLREQAKIARQNGNETAAKAYEKTATALDETPHTIKDFRSFKEDFVKVNKIYDKVLENENGGAVRMARGFRGALNTAKDMLLEKPLYYGASKVGGALSTAGNAVRNSNLELGGTTIKTPTQPISQDALNILTNATARTEANRAADTNIQNARQNEDYRTLEEQLSNNLGNIEALYPTQAQMNPAQMEAQRQISNIANAMNSAMAAGDIEAYNQLANLYKSAYSMYEMQYPTQTTSTASTKLSEKQQKANSAEEILNSLENLDRDFGYTVRDIPVLNLVNMGGNKYSTTADALATQLGYMMSGATVTPAEYERIKQQYVPQPWDSEEQRKYKLQEARKVIAKYQQGYADETNA